mgnify:CR=1 FL=1
MFVIWGHRHYGKGYLLNLFKYNRMDVTLTQIGGMFLSHQWKYIDADQRHIKYFRFIEDGHITIETKCHRLSSDELLEYDEPIGLKWAMSVAEDYIFYGKLTDPKYCKTNQMKGRELYPIYADNGKIWHDHFFKDLCDCDVYFPRPHPQIWYDPFIHHFKTCRNIVPYKTNILDITIARINLFESRQTNKTFNVNIKNVEEAYYLDKNLVWTHLDDFVRNNRNVEQKLVDNNIPYEYLDLDNHDYRDYVKKDLPPVGVSREGANTSPNKTFKISGKMDYDSNKENERYLFARRISEEYIKERGLTDLRLSGRIHDRI